MIRRTTQRLEQLRAYYDTVAVGATERLKQMCTFLAHRETSTIAALEEWLNEVQIVTKVWIRQGDSFPYEPAARRPTAPSGADLLEVARETDDQLEQLVERIATYVSAEQSNVVLGNVRTLVAGRREKLDAAAREHEQGC